MSKLKIVSLNVNGMVNAITRKIIFNKLRDQKADLCLLQETHSSPTTGFLWTREWGGQIFYSPPSSRGVAILLNPNSALTTSSHLGDGEGRFLALNVTFQDEPFTVCSLYSPTQDKPRIQAEFLETVDTLLSQAKNDNHILGGGFHCIRDSDLDKNTQGPSHPQGAQGRTALDSLIEEWDLEDVWRARHPNRRVLGEARSPQDWTSF